MNELKKSVLIISQIPIYNVKGKAGIQVLGETVNGFISRGYSIDLIYPLYQMSDNSFAPQFNDFNEHTFDAVVYHKFATKPFLSYLGKLLLFPYFVHKVKSIYNQKLKEKNYSIVYGIGPMGSYTMSKLSYNNNPIKVARYLGVASSYERFVVPFLKLLVFPDILGFKAKSDAIIITNDGTKGDEFIKKVNKTVNNVFFYRNGINKELFLKSTPKDYLRLKYKLDINTKVLLVVSRLSKLKRIDRSISLVEKIKKQYKNFKLIIVGGGNSYPKLLEIAKAKQLEKYIIFTGPIPHNELVFYYNAADIFMSFYDTSNAGNPLFEAMLTGNCVITINTGNTKDFVPENTGVIFDKFNSNQIGNKVVKLLKNDKKRELICKNAKKFAIQTFQNWNQRINTEISAIENLKKNP